MKTSAFREKYLFWDNRNHFLGLLSTSRADVPGRTVCGFQLRFSSFGLSFSPKIKRQASLSPWLFLTIRGVNWNAIWVHLLVPACYVTTISANPCAHRASSQSLIKASDESFFSKGGNATTKHPTQISNLQPHTNFNDLIPGKIEKRSGVGSVAGHKNIQISTPSR